MKWTKTADAAPVAGGNERESIACLVIRRKQIEILCFNTFYQCWDYEDGDDRACDIAEVEYWMRLSDIPKPA